jgi:S-DNA-T family DNA segregation ATPase FtsK/SpoIIIE
MTELPGAAAAGGAFPRVGPLPESLTWDSFRMLLGGADRRPVRASALLLGAADGTLEPYFLELDDGGLLLVAGGAGTGKTTVLEVLPRLNPGTDRQSPVEWLGPGAEDDPSEFWSELAAGAGDARGAALLVDDAHRLNAPALDGIRRLLLAGARAVIAAPNSAAALARAALTPDSRQHGLILAPRRPQDGEFFGARLDCFGHAPPGRAAVVVGGSIAWIQVPLPPAAAGHGRPLRPPGRRRYAG